MSRALELSWLSEPPDDRRVAWYPASPVGRDTPVETVVTEDHGTYPYVPIVYVEIPAELIQEHYEAIHALHQEATLKVTVRGEETTATRYRAQARLLATGASIPIYLYVSNPVESERDFLVGVAAHPRTSDPQEDTVRRLLNGIVHPTAP